MKRKTNIVLVSLAMAAGVSTVPAQTLLWSDNFDDNYPTDWIPSFNGQINETNQEFIASGNFGPTPPASPADTFAFGYHSLGTSGALPDQQTIEARVDLVGANQDDAIAHLQFLWFKGATTHAYSFWKDQDEIGLLKSWDLGGSIAYFLCTNQPIKNQNVTLVLTLTRRGSNVEINTRVLDKDNGNAVLWNCTVTDTPQSDPVVLSSPMPDQEIAMAADRPETPWPVESAPDSILLGMAWINTQHGSDGAATATFDNLEVWQYEVPPLAIQNAVVLSWPVPQTQFALEKGSSVDGPWEPVADSWCRTNNTQIEVRVPAPESIKCYRLCQLCEPCSQDVSPCDPAWYEAAPNPDWGLPATLGDLLPAQYYDSDIIGAYFLVPLAGLQSLLPPGVRALEANAATSPWSSLGSAVSGMGVLNVYFAEYKQNQYIEPYNEAITSVMIDDPLSQGLGAWYATHLTVTSEQAQWGGIAGWGYPKIMGDVQVQSVESNSLACFDTAGGEPIMSLEVSTEGMVPMSSGPVLMVSTKDGYLVRARWVMSGSQYVSWTSGASTITLGENHPIALQLQAIGVGMYPSIGQFRGEHLQGTLYAGTCAPLWQYESPTMIQNAVVLSWPFSQGQRQFEVVTAPTLGGPWEPIPDPWCRTNATHVEVCVPAPDSMKFFRLGYAP